MQLVIFSLEQEIPDRVYFFQLEIEKLYLFSKNGITKNTTQEKGNPLQKFHIPQHDSINRL